MTVHAIFGRVLTFLHTVVICTWVVCITVVLGIAAIVTSYFSKTGNAVHWVAKIWGRAILLVSLVKVHVHGTEHLVRGRSVIFMSNHQSNFDIPVFFCGLPVQFRWLAKAELFKIPIFGRGMRGAGYISIDRSDRRSAMASLARAAETIRDGASVLIFPEGTRTKDGSLRDFKKGGFILAVDAGVPVVPMAVYGTFDIMPRGSLLIRRRSVHIAFGPAIDAAKYNRATKSELMDAVRDAIQDILDRLQAGQTRG